MKIGVSTATTAVGDRFAGAAFEQEPTMTSTPSTIYKWCGNERRPAAGSYSLSTITVCHTPPIP